jgi:hypothetical protein
LDPIAAKRCPVSNDAQFQTAVDALGGINWTHPVDILKDLSLPPLYRGHIPPVQYVPDLQRGWRIRTVPNRRPPSSGPTWSDIKTAPRSSSPNAMGFSP